MPTLVFPRRTALNPRKPDSPLERMPACRPIEPFDVTMRAGNVVSMKNSKEKYDIARLTVASATNCADADRYVAAARARRYEEGGTVRVERRTAGTCRRCCPDPSSRASHPTVLRLLHCACRRTADHFPDRTVGERRV
ncbi:hypothetical protein K6W16_11610 [Burkholderia dolosa]|uniref:Uncharacterized protein n=1 Tax=Burkholderia dolosa TaxID=152500 RepID=A0A892I666_9BURK|nr:hypothetical protein [Burkholderia dolosa]MBY4751034.1 hypothetical protein [Burkholderia dolosa]MBY4843641.1 hypothetical protein [Burkholderia dolosa]MBY4941392.1 hypothetical protein [Burkholderia dolosa]MCC5030630.1 hypothetical protein [Burkholderia dolosa]QRO78595.1 hypothetical protein I6K02_06765 [Burkholderia dolosa]